MNKNRILTLLFLVIISCVIAQPAGAWAPGGCVSDKTICYGPTLSAPGIIFDLDGRLEIDALIGAGYEVRFMANKFYSVGTAVLADFDRSNSGASSARISLAASLFRAFRVGLGIELREGQKPRGYGIFSLGMYFENPI